jgi:protein-tyrosine phosphatase
MVEGVFRHAVVRAGLAAQIDIDSAGTGGWHVGRPPDRRAIATAQRRGYDLTRLRARQVSASDFARFAWILAMDRANLHALEAMRPRAFAGHLGLFLGFASGAERVEVPDPYQGDTDAFELVLDLAEQGSSGLLCIVQDHVMRAAQTRAP